MHVKSPCSLKTSHFRYKNHHSSGKVTFFFHFFRQSLSPERSGHGVDSLDLEAAVLAGRCGAETSVSYACFFGLVETLPKNSSNHRVMLVKYKPWVIYINQLVMMLVMMLVIHRVMMLVIYKPWCLPKP